MLSTSFIENRSGKFISQFKNILRNKKNTFIIAIALILVSIFSLVFVPNNEIYYKKPIAKVTAITEKTSQVESITGKVESVKKQQINAIIMNGSHKGKNIQLQNTASFSGVNDIVLKINDEVFLSIEEGANKEIISSKILDLKRDKYILTITIFFVLLILLVARNKGLRSLCSVTINVIIFVVTIELFLHGYNLMILAIIASILFIVLSILIVCGVNKKAFSAIIGTLTGTVISMAIAALVIHLTGSNGMHFEEMEFLTHPPEQIFFIEILIGTLGAIMDIAISISSSLKEIYDKNPNIEKKILVNSGVEIGKDIMGTMANTLLFAYISGSIPIILLLLRNNFSVSYIISINLSLEFIRGLTGSIGIVLSIPITIFTSVLILKNQKIGEF